MHVYTFLVADITWSAYALAMFTPEERAAAVAAVYEPPEDIRPIPPVVPSAGQISSGLGIRITGPGIPASGYDPNKPSELKELHRLGWRFEAGRWIPPGALGLAADSDGAIAASGARPPGVSSVISASTVQGASVLGSIVPFAPPVLLPSFVGGRVGVVRIGGGMRPESGGNPDRIRFGDPNLLPVVRMMDAGGGGGGGSW